MASELCDKTKGTYETMQSQKCSESVILAYFKTKVQSIKQNSFGSPVLQSDKK
jgi:hypothetical protein